MSAAPVRAAEGRRGRALASLQHREFRWIFASNTFFWFAMNGQFVVRSILAYKLTESAFALGLINLAVAVPMLLISPLGGVIADRFERRRLIMAGQFVLFSGELVILVLLLFNLLQFWHLLAAVFVMGGCFPVIMPARQAIVANIVGRQGLPNALALTTGSMNAARVVGPVLAGSVVAFLGVRPAYVLAVLLYAGGLYALSHISPAYPEKQQGKRSVYGDIADGFLFVMRDPPIRILMLLGLVPIMLAMPFQALLVVFAEDVWNTGSVGLGLLQAAAGLGGLVGSVFVAMRSGSNQYLRFMMASMVLFASTLFLFALSPWFLLALPLVFIADIFASTFNTLNNTLIQVLVPEKVRGRVNSLMMMTFGLTPLGTVPVSAVAEAWGAPVAVGGAALISLTAGVVLFMLNRTLRNIDETVDRAMKEEEVPAREAPPPPAQPPAPELAAS